MSLTTTRTARIARHVDGAFGWYGAASAAFLAVVLVTQAFARGWSQAWFVLVVYLVIAYFVLPRVQTALAAVYLPDYFIGRTRTREGILGDPVNIAVLGDVARIHETMRAAGWMIADDLGIRANARIAFATLARRSYPTAPVSNLFLFGHRQAFCYQQQIGGTPGKRHHVRFWPTPAGWLLPGGRRADWLAAGSFDRSVGLSVFTWQVTHRIEGDVDVERDHVVAAMTHALPGASVSVIENFSTGYHARNGGGDAIETDGNLPVVDLRGVVVENPSEERARRTSGTPRPVDVVVGALLMALRPLAWAVLVVALLEGRPVDGVSPATSGFEIAAALVFVVIWWVVAGGVFLGRNGARLSALLLTGAAVALVGASWFHGTDSLTMQNGLAGFALDVAILFALSGREARQWALGRKRRRRFHQEGSAAPPAA